MSITQYIISVRNSGYTHAEAAALATAHGGTLACLETAEENSLFLTFLDQDDKLWSAAPGGSALLGPWIGLTQTSGSGEPGGGWAWESGPFVTFTAWHPSQPDNFAGDSFGIFFDFAGSIGWGDTINDPGAAGFGAVTSAAIEVSPIVTDLDGTAGHDFIWGGDISNQIVGGGGADLIYAGVGGDTIFGGNGNDTIYGGGAGGLIEPDVREFDQIVGGKGADHFVYAAASESPLLELASDFIFDFKHKQGDVIDLSAIDAIPGGGHDPLQLIGKHQFSGVGQIRYFIEDGLTAIDINLTGNKFPEMRIILVGEIAVHVSDFIL